MDERAACLKTMKSCDMLLRSQTRIDLLFTMSEIPHARPVKDATCEVMFRGRCFGHNSPSSLFRASPGRIRSPCPAAPRIAEGEAWWSQTGSNRRPHACKARALPTELWPQSPWKPARESMSSTCLSARGVTRSVVGPGRLELPTSRLSGVCSNQLSYRPLKRSA